MKTPLKEQSQNEVIMRLSGTKPVHGMISPKEVLESLKKACKSSLKKKAENDENQDKENNQPKDCTKAGEKPLTEDLPKEWTKIEEKPLTEEVENVTEVQVVVEITEGDVSNQEKNVVLHEGNVGHQETNFAEPEEKTQNTGMEVKENKDGGLKERNEGKPRSKTPVKLEEKKSVELSTNKSSVKSIGKVALFYHKCGICNKNMIIGKEKTRLLSCTHRFHEECIASKANRCFLCDGLEAYDSRPSERSLKKTLV